MNLILIGTGDTVLADTPLLMIVNLQHFSPKEQYSCDLSTWTQLSNESTQSENNTMLQHNCEIIHIWNGAAWQEKGLKYTCQKKKTNTRH